MRITVNDDIFFSLSSNSTDDDIYSLGRRIGRDNTVYDLILEESTQRHYSSLPSEARKRQWHLFARGMTGNRSIEKITFHSFDDSFLYTILPYFKEFLKNNPSIKVVDLEQSFSFHFRDILGSIVCDKSSMAATYNSNHTIRFPGLMGIFRLNRNENKRLVARKKVFMHYLLTDEQCKKSLGPVKAPVLMKYIEFTDRVIAENKEKRTLIKIIRPYTIIFERTNEIEDRLEKGLRLGFLYNVLKTQVDKVFNTGE